MRGLDLRAISICAVIALSACTKSTEDASVEPGAQSGEGPEHGDHHTHGAQPSADHDGRGHHRHHRFEDADEWAKQFDDPSRDEWQRPQAVVDFIAPAEDAVIADLGAGTGYFAVHLARAAPKGLVLANDIEPDMVRYLGERAQREGLPNLKAVQGEADDPALPQPVDIAFMCNVYHHIEAPEVFFEHVVETLQPGGRVVIVEFKKDADEGIPGPPPAMRIAQERLVEQLGAVGLVLQRSDREALPHQYIVELVKK
ncbi:MAG: class I SAM-dependent methyltransferase [Myxococcota bacterium]